MDSPVFRLEGIVKSRDETSDFEGPLTLILQLLSKNKVEIRDISISLILEQYLEYLDNMASLDLDIASEFVSMASHLAYIKTKMLLTGGEEITELEQLISSLEDLRRGDVYVQIKAAAETLAGMYMRGGAMLPGPPEYLPEDTEYKFLHDISDVLDAVVVLIGREDAVIKSVNPRQTGYPRRISYSVHEKISEILGRLRMHGDTLVFKLFAECGSRTEIVATMIAVLELCKVGSAALSGDGDDLSISFTGTEIDTLPEDYETMSE